MNVVRFAVCLLIVALQGCAPTLPNWQMTDPALMLPASYFSSGIAPASEKEAIDVYFGDRDMDVIEGIWVWGDSSFLVAIIRNDTGIYTAYDYLGVIVRSYSSFYSHGWSPGQVNLLLNASADPRVYTGANYGPRRNITNSPFILESPNVMKMSVYDRSSSREIETMLVRQYPDSRNGMIAASQRGESQGTCFLVSRDGVAVTSRHVVEKAKEISVILADGRKMRAVVTKQSSANDIAILKLEATTPDYLSFVTASSTRIGDEIFTIGFPSKIFLGSEAKFTEGSISALSGYQGDASNLQISAPVQPGSSGGQVGS